jgi:hypothetical protein
VSTIVVRLYSSSPSIVKAVQSVCAEHEFTFEHDTGPRPETASFVVSTAAHSRDVVVLANQYNAPIRRCEPIVLPEAALYMAAAARYARGLILVGSDHIRGPRPEPKQPEGVLF